MLTAYSTVPTPTVPPSLTVATSPGNFQYWFFLREAVSAEVGRVLGERIRAAPRTPTPSGSERQAAGAFAGGAEADPRHDTRVGHSGGALTRISTFVGVFGRNSSANCARIAERSAGRG